MKKEMSEKEKEKFITKKENEFLEKKVLELNKDVDEQILKINDELMSKNKNIGIIIFQNKKKIIFPQKWKRH